MPGWRRSNGCKANLKRYKAAVLKAACEGKLVPQDPNDEPADVLLERILQERREKWEAEQRAKGKRPGQTEVQSTHRPGSRRSASVAGGVGMGDGGTNL